MSSTPSLTLHVLRQNDPSSSHAGMPRIWHALLPQFEALTGIKVRAEKVPPGQIRQKAMLDLSSKTTTYATHAADPMYYPLYVANKWVDPLDRYLLAKLRQLMAK